MPQMTIEETVQKECTDLHWRMNTCVKEEKYFEARNLALRIMTLCRPYLTPADSNRNTWADDAYLEAYEVLQDIITLSEEKRDKK